MGGQMTQRKQKATNNGRYLKNFNLLLGILMLVVVSLNIEQVLHNRQIFKSDNFKLLNLNNNHNNRHEMSTNVVDEKVDHPGNNESIYVEKLNQCRVCQNEALTKLNNFNIAGGLIAVFLAVYSFLFAFKIELFERYLKLLVGGSVLLTISAIVYIVLASIAQLPAICVDSFLNKNWGCNADFKYSFESKIIPLSILMLVVLPQILVRSLFKFIKSFKRKTEPMEHKLDDAKNPEISPNETKLHKEEYKIDTFARLNNLNLNENPLSRVQETQNLLNPIYGDRELPVDCPLGVDNSSCTVMPNDLKLADSILDELTSSYDDYSLVNFRPSTLTKRYYMRNSSLSTITEEKTLATLLNSTNELAKTHDAESNLNSAGLIETIIGDLRDNAILLNEILNVFEPSSRDGHFVRNVPVRFSSPCRRKDATSTPEKQSSPASLLATHTSSPSLATSSAQYSNFTSPTSYSHFNRSCDKQSTSTKSPTESLNNSTSHNRAAIFRKIRFVKRLKNRLEAKNGYKFPNYRPVLYMDTTHSSNLTSFSSSPSRSTTAKNYNIKLKKCIELNLQTNANSLVSKITKGMKLQETNVNFDQVEQRSTYSSSSYQENYAFDPVPANLTYQHMNIEPAYF